jgi:crotonobetainyl-CoA:carnitine CoA-transferase CaiB-like acyl-CoA transferase
MTKPLEGILVADFTTLLPGPLATLMLAEAGAEVVKIERPGGETARAIAPFLRGHSAAFAMLNRGKKSLIADLKSEQGNAAAADLVARADVLVEQFRPGVMERLGFGYDAVRAKNPRLVYCSISGYGQTGPKSGEAGHDINYIGETGLLSLSPGPRDRPVVPPALIADIGGGTFPAVINILLGLLQRAKTGQGSYIDVAMTDAMFTFAWYSLAALFATGKLPDTNELRYTGVNPRYQIYTTKDGQLVACGALEQHFWLAFCQAIGLPAEFVDDLSHPEATRDAVRKTIAAQTAAHWKPKFAAADCCVTVVRTLEQALVDPHFVGRGLFAHQVDVPGGPPIPALPVPIAPHFRADEKLRPFPPRPKISER